MSIHEQARAEAEKRYPVRMVKDMPLADEYDENVEPRATFFVGFLAGHEAATRTRAVTTVTELDALPVGSVVRVKRLAYIKYAPRAWIGARNRRVDSLTLSAFGPLIVLYEPEEGR